jgi:hypothetical protein
LNDIHRREALKKLVSACALLSARAGLQAQQPFPSKPVALLCGKAARGSATKQIGVRLD